MQKIYLILLVIIFTFCLNVNNGFSAKAEKIVKVGAVDLQKVFENSQGKKIAEEQLDKDRAAFEKDKKTKEDEIKALKDDFETKKFTLSDSDKQKMDLTIRQKTVELKEFIEKSNDSLTKEEDKLLAPLIDDIKDVIRAVSIKFGYDIILDKSTYILFINKDFDITQDVIDELKAKYKK